MKNQKDAKFRILETKEGQEKFKIGKKYFHYVLEVHSSIIEDSRSVRLLKVWQILDRLWPPKMEPTYIREKEP